MNKKSVGPTYLQVAERYDSDEATIQTIASKIMNGGGGNWGEVAMAAHPQFSQEEAKTIAAYIVSLDEESPNPVLPASGSFVADQHKPGEQGTYIFQVSYTDAGGDPIGPLTSTFGLRLKPANMPATMFSDQFKGGRARNIGDVEVLTGIEDGAWLKYADIDLTGIREVKVHGGTLGSRTNNWVTTDGPFTLELRRTVDGAVIGRAALPALKGMNDQQVAVIPISAPGEMGDLYLTFSYNGNDEAATAAISRLEFVRGAVVVEN